MAKGRSTVLIASLIWGSSILLSRFIGLIKDGVLGRILGGGEAFDIYTTAFTLPDFLTYLLAGSALSLVFIQIFNDHIARDDEDGAWQTFSDISVFLTVVLAVFIPCAWWLTPLINQTIIAPGFGPDQLEELNRLVRIMLPATLFHMIGGLISATLQARDQHALPAMSGLVYTTGIILGGLILGPTMGAEGFAWGVLAGSILGAFGLPFIGALRHGLRWRPRLKFSNPSFRAYFIRSLPVMLGVSIIVLDDMFLKQQASFLAEGSAATLMMGKTLMRVPMGIFGFAAGAAAYPTLTRLIGQGDREGAYVLVSRSVRRMLVLCFGAQVGMSAAGPEIARVIYGHRLLAGQPTEVGISMAILSIGLWAWAAQLIVSRGFYAQGKTWLPTLIGTTVTVLGYPIYILARQWGGIYALSLTSAAMISVYVIALIVFLRRDFQSTADGYVGYFARTVPAVLIGLLAGYLARLALPPVQIVVDGALYGIIGAAVYVAAAAVLGVEEVREVGEMVSERVKRRLGRG
ncbi:MAG: lipid II flippase MurJ [Myxococcota bacterium]